MSKITTAHLERAACVYVRQSSIGQVQTNHESRKRQYALADRAKELGFDNVIIIDEDLGLSGAGTPRPGFERLLALMCEGQVGAVFAFEASRLARNGRDWHTLLEICALVESVLVDEEAVYDPRQPNDRLLLGMKGTFSEMLRGLCGPSNRSWRQCSLESLPRKAFPNGATHRGPSALKSPVTRNHQIGQTQEYQMINTMQPIVNLAKANLNATTRFMQSPDIAELTKSNIDKYVTVTQESFAYLAQSGAMRQWSRDSMDNVSRFANEYLQSVFGVFGLMTQGQNLFANRMQDFSNKVEQGVEATAQAFDQSAEEIEGQAEESVEEGVDEVSHLSKARAKQHSKAR